MHNKLKTKFIWLILINTLAATFAFAGPSVDPILTLNDSDTGINRNITIESTSQFRLVFEAADNWGISKWYDLVNDPDAKTNLAYSTFADEGVQEAGLFQMVWSGTNPDDPKLFMYAAKHYWPKAARSFNIIENTPGRIVVESVCHPLLAAGVLTSVTVAVKYSIYPDGRIYLNTKMNTTEQQNIKEWRCAVLGLRDPSLTGDAGVIDLSGWIRSSSTQSPYEWKGNIEKSLFAFWSKETADSLRDWTKASIMIVSDTANEYITRQNRHSWKYFKRWYYTCDGVPMNSGDTITQNYLIQLGAENSLVLPNIINSTVADPIADAYIASPYPPVNDSKANPTVALIAPSGNTNTKTISITIKFSETISGLSQSDFQVTNGTSSDFTVVTPGLEYSINVTASNPGTVTVTLPAGSVVDVDGNDNIIASSSFVYQTVTGIVPFHEAYCKIFPNPASSGINVQSAAPVTISLMNIQGLLLINKQDIANSSIDISHLPGGLYLVKIESGNEFHFEKIIKQ